MAGGPHASAAACWRCAERADRINEGIEVDRYRCGSCGYEFGVDFDQGGAPSAPMWPIPPEKRAELLAASKALFGDGASTPREKTLDSVAQNAFPVDRDLLGYQRVPGTGFTRFLATLGPEAHWIDAGAGHAAAAGEYLRSDAFPEKARVTAVGVVRPDSAGLDELEAAFPPPAFRYVSGCTIEETPSKSWVSPTWSPTLAANVPDGGRGVDRREHHRAAVGEPQRPFDRGRAPQRAERHDVRTGSERVVQRLLEGRHVSSDLALGHETAVAPLEVLDGIFDGVDVTAGSGGDLLDQVRHRARATRAAGTRDQDQAAVPRADRLHVPRVLLETERLGVRKRRRDRVRLGGRAGGAGLHAQAEATRTGHLQRGREVAGRPVSPPVEPHRVEHLAEVRRDRRDEVREWIARHLIMVHTRVLLPDAAGTGQTAAGETLFGSRKGQLAFATLTDEALKEAFPAVEMPASVSLNVRLAGAYFARRLSIKTAWRASDDPEELQDMINRGPGLARPRRIE